MKKGKIPVVITIGIACFALCTVMLMQFKIVNETDITSIETMREEELRTELASWKEKYKEADEQYEEKTAKLDEYKNKEQSDAETSDLVKEEQKKIETYLGTTDVEGEGIKITLRDLSQNDPITATDLLRIIDYLKAAGAEAISINDERIINMSEIVYVNESIVYINQQRILSPYVIQVIGNQTYLESALLGNGGYIDVLTNLGYDISIEKDSKISIKKYNKEITSKYID